MWFLFILILAIFLFSFYIKYYLFYKYHIFSQDEFIHFSIIKLIKKNKKIPSVFNSFLMDEKYQLPFAYPPLMHYLLSFFSTEWVVKNRKIISFFVDFTNTILLYFFSYFLTNSFIAASQIILIFLLISFSSTDNSLLTPRVFGFVIVNLVMCLLAISFSMPLGVAAALLLVIAGFVISIFFLHKFTVQALLLSILPILFLSSYRIEVIIVILLSLLILVQSKLYSQKILPEHIGCIRKTYLQYKNTSFNLKEMVVTIIYSAPFMLLMGFFLTNYSFFFENNIIKFMIAWTIPLQIFSYLAIFVKPLRAAVGEGERYRMYNFYPLSFLLGYFLFNYWQALNLILVFLSVIPMPLLALRLTCRKITSGYNKLTPEIEKLCNYIKFLPRENILPLASNISSVVAYLSQKKVLNCLNIDFVRRHPDLFPHIRKPYAEIIREFSIDYVLVEKTYLSSAKALGQLKNENIDLETLYETPNYFVYSIKK